MQKKKILIIDDTATVVAWASKVLREAGYAVSSRNVAIGSAAAILREQPDLVLMDINMPALKGDEIIRDFRRKKSEKRVRLVLHSSLSLGDLSNRAKACGADGFIQKTNDQTKFIRKIKHLLRDSPESKREPNPDRNGYILIFSDKLLLKAAVRLITSDYPRIELIQIDDDLEVAQLLETRGTIDIVIIELKDDGSTLHGKTMNLLSTTHTTLPAILIGKDESILDIEKRQNTFLIRSDPLIRSELHDAIVSLLSKSNQMGS